MSLLLKVTAILVIGLAAARVARTVPASVRHWILVATFAAVALLPLAVAALPTVRFAVPIAQGAGNAPASTERPLTTTSPEGPGVPPEGPGDLTAVPLAQAVRPGMILTSIWLTGVAFCLASLVSGIYRVQRLRRTALPTLAMQSTMSEIARSAGLGGRVDIMIHEHLTAPIACGIVRPAIILPPDAPAWTAAALQRALVHELEHLRRHDWLTQLIARAVCAALWFHPLVWIAHRWLCLYAEHACDDAVIARHDSTTYADQLVSLARRMAARPRVAVLGMAQRSDLSARVTAVLDAARPRGRAGIVRGTTIAMATTMILAALAPLTVIATEATSPSGAAQRRTIADYLGAQLIEAIDNGDVAIVRELLDHGANVNAAVDGDGSPLIVAAREGHLDLVRLLLDRGADPNLGVPGDGAALIMAAREGHLAIVQVLLDRGADIELVVPGDENALIQASGEGHLGVVKLLVSRGANVNARVLVEGTYTAIGSDARGRGRWDAALQEWRTPLKMATRGGHAAVAAFLRSAGAVE
jgi:beta-lactamase regulating signal transducer with metallopeptidase domain